MRDFYRDYYINYRLGDFGQHGPELIENYIVGHIFFQKIVFYHQEFIVLRTALGGDTRDIAEPTYKTFNLPTRQKYDRIQDFQLTYKTFNLLLYKIPTAY